MTWEKVKEWKALLINAKKKKKSLSNEVTLNRP